MVAYASGNTPPTRWGLCSAQLVRMKEPRHEHALWANLVADCVGAAAKADLDLPKVAIGPGAPRLGKSASEVRARSITSTARIAARRFRAARKSTRRAMSARAASDRLTGTVTSWRSASLPLHGSQQRTPRLEWLGQWLHI